MTPTPATVTCADERQGSTGRRSRDGTIEVHCRPRSARNAETGTSTTNRAAHHVDVHRHRRQWTSRDVISRQPVDLVMVTDGPLTTVTHHGGGRRCLRDASDMMVQLGHDQDRVVTDAAIEADRRSSRAERIDPIRWAPTPGDSRRLRWQPSVDGTVRRRRCRSACRRTTDSHRNVHPPGRHHAHGATRRAGGGVGIHADNIVALSRELEADADRITVTFSSGTVPSSITRDDIRCGAASPATQPAWVLLLARLSVRRRVSSSTRTIRFLSPVDAPPEAAW